MSDLQLNHFYPRHTYNHNRIFYISQDTVIETDQEKHDHHRDDFFHLMRMDRPKTRTDSTECWKWHEQHPFVE